MEQKIIMLKQEKYETSVITSGGNLYTHHAVIKRRAIFYWCFK
jgi:hypothetical protein